MFTRNATIAQIISDSGSHENDPFSQMPLLDSRLRGNDGSGGFARCPIHLVAAMPRQEGDLKHVENFYGNGILVNRSVLGK